MSSFLAILFTIILSVCSFPALSNSFEIPRSETLELTDPSSKRVYPLFVKLPRSYHSNKEQRYPVIYLTDAWYSFQVTSGATRFPMNSGVMEEAIIVGISYSKGSRGSSSRVRDYTPSKAASWKLETGGAEAHAKFIRDTVFLYIDGNYRTKAAERTFVGNSLGGLFGAYILFEHPDMFSSYILGSPSVWFDDNHILSSPMTKPNKSIKVYLAVGGLEMPEFGEREQMVTGATQLVEKINAQSNKNIDLKFHIIQGARHATAFPTTLIQGLDWIYGKHQAHLN